MKVNSKRVKELNNIDIGSAPIGGGPAAYWMSRDQRVCDNWALIYARQLADKLNIPLMVLFCLAEDYFHRANHVS